MIDLLSLSYHPGAGRGPVAMVSMIERRANQFMSPNWAPACAGVALMVEALGGAHG
jgi:hypothetical protein